MEPLLTRLRAQLATLADPAVALGAERYFHHPDGLHHYGVRTPDIRRLAREAFADEMHDWTPARRNALCRALWTGGHFEEGVLAIELYRRLARQCGPCEFMLFSQWLDRYVHNWAHCDGVTQYLLRAALHNDPALVAELPAWTASPNRWKRRAAATALIHEVRRGQHLTEALSICDLLRRDADDMVRKGVGWMLKNAAQFHPAPTLRFLFAADRPAFPRPVLRIVAEKLPSLYAKL